MYQRYNTSNMPSTDTLRICLSCWKRIPTHFSRKILQHKFPNTSLLTCNGTCGTRWSSPNSFSRCFSNASNSDEYDVSNNPFYKKYEKKLKHLKEENPEKFESKVAGLKDYRAEMKRKMAAEGEKLHGDVSQKPRVPGDKKLQSWPPKSLDEIMKLDLVKDLEPDAIKQLWQEHHLSKDCLFSVLNPEDYDEMMAKSKLNPSFLYTLPKGDGFEFYLSQFGGKDVYFTSLGMYQLLNENAPPCLTLAHFPELKDDKGLVLMAGEYDDKVIKKNEALNLAKQMTLYYGKNAAERYTLLRQFNASPEKFQYMDIVEEYKRHRDFLEEMPF